MHKSPAAGLPLRVLRREKARAMTIDRQIHQRQPEKQILPGCCHVRIVFRPAAHNIQNAPRQQQRRAQCGAGTQKGPRLMTIAGSLRCSMLPVLRGSAAKDGQGQAAAPFFRQNAQPAAVFHADAVLHVHADF